MIEELERKNNSPRGITLVALVVTIVVLIILAVISINIIFGEDGIIEKTKISKQEMANAQAEEQELIATATNSMDKYIAGERENVTIPKEEYEALKKKGTWELLATNTTTTQTEYEVSDLSKFSSVAILVYTSGKNVGQTSEISYDIFKKLAETQNVFYANHNNNNNNSGNIFQGAAMYVSDTKVKLYCSYTNTAKIELYGIY